MPVLDKNGKTIEVDALVQEETRLRFGLTEAYQVQEVHEAEGDEPAWVEGWGVLGTYDGDASKVVVVMDAGTARARAVPEKKAMLEEISRGLHGDFGGFNVDESDAIEVDRDDVAVNVYGFTKDGLKFGARVSVVDVWVADV